MSIQGMLKLPVFNFSSKSPSAGTLDVFIDGEIVDAETEQFMKDYFGDDTSVSYRSFRETIDNANPKRLNIYINSIGGHVGDGLAMHDYIIDLQNSGTDVNVFVRGWCASVATYFLMAVPLEKRYASANSFGLIHNVSGGVSGDLRTLQSYVSMAEKMNKNVVDMYVSNTKLSHQKITDMMDAETVLSADEMLQYGFIGNKSPQAPLTNKVDVTAYNFKNSAAILNASKSFTNNSVTKTYEIVMDTKKITDAITNGFNTLLEKMGIKDKANDDNVKNAFTEFSTSITNAVKDVATPDAESVKNLVNAAVAEGLKTLGDNESVKNAIKEATKDAVTKDDLKNATKDTISKEDFKNLKDELVQAITDKAGDKSKGEGGDGGDKSNTKNKRPKNRFSGREWMEN